MEKTWDIVKGVVGAFVIVYGLQGAFGLAKELGKQEALKELECNPRVLDGKQGEPVQIACNGKKWKLVLEEVKDNQS